MLLVFSPLMGFLLFASYKKDKASPLNVFLSVWTFIFFMYGLRLYEIIPVDTMTEVFIITGVMCFYIGYQFANRIQLSNESDNIYDSECTVDSRFNYFAVKVMLILDYIYAVPTYFSKITRILQYGWTVNAAKELLSEGSDVFNLYVFDPFNFFLVALIAYLIIYNRKEKFIIVSGIVINALSFLATGSRSRIIFFALCFLSMSMTELSDIFSRLKKKVKLCVAIIAMVVVLVSGYGLALFKNLYFYFCTCVPLFDRIVTHSDAHFTMGMTYGALSLNGILRIIPNFIENYVNSSIKIQPFEIAEKYIEYFEYACEIAPGQITNSFYSFIANFYLDFGIFGITLVAFAYGIIICVIYRRNSTNRTAKSKLLLAFIYYAMFFSMVRCSWMGIRFAVGFMFVYIFAVSTKRVVFTFNGSAIKTKI